MISRLRKKLTWQFLALTMLVFTVMQGRMLYNVVYSNWMLELTAPEQIASNIIEAVERGEPVEKLDIAKYYDPKDGFLIFISNDQVHHDNAAAWGDRGIELLEEVRNGTEKRPTAGSGDLSSTIRTHVRPVQGKNMRRIAELTVTGWDYDLTILHPGTPLKDIIRPQIKEYLSVWCSMLAAMSLVSLVMAKQAVGPVERSLKSQRNFIASASHELKAPLAVIQVNAETLQTGDTVRKQRVILEECDRMSGLILSLLSLASSDAGNWSMNTAQTDVDSLLIEIWEAFTEPARQRQIRLDLDLEEGYPPIFCDRERLVQALSILVDNAISYSKPQTSVVLGARVKKEAIIFSVIDHGPGIPDSEKEKVFERFYTCDPSRTDKSHCGLGLSIAQEIVKAHHGTIRLTDTCGGGCTFEIELT